MLEMKVGRTKKDKSETTYKLLNQKNGLNIYLDAHGRLEKFYENGITIDISNLNPFKDKVTYEEFVVLHHGYLGENTVMLRKVRELLKEKLNDEYLSNPIQFMLKYHPKYTKQMLPKEKFIHSIINSYENKQKEGKNTENPDFLDVKEKIITSLKNKLKKNKQEIEQEFSDRVSSLYSIKNLINYVIDTEPLIDENILNETLYRLSVSWEPIETQYYEVFNENDDMFHRALWGRSSFGKNVLLSQIKKILKEENVEKHIQNFLNGKINEPIHIFFKTSKILPIPQMRALYYWLIHQMNNLINGLFEKEKHKNEISIRLNEGLERSDKNPEKSVLHKKWFSEKYINYTVTYIANNFLRGNVKYVWPHLDIDKKDGNSNLFLNVYEFEKIPNFIREKVDTWKLYEPKTKKEYTEIKRFLTDTGINEKIPSLKKLSQVKSHITKIA